MVRDPRRNGDVSADVVNKSLSCAETGQSQIRKLRERKVAYTYELQNLRDRAIAKDGGRFAGNLGPVTLGRLKQYGSISDDDLR